MDVPLPGWTLWRNTPGYQRRAYLAAHGVRDVEMPVALLRMEQAAAEDYALALELVDIPPPPRSVRVTGQVAPVPVLPVGETLAQPAFQTAMAGRSGPIARLQPVTAADLAAGARILSGNTDLTSRVAGGELEVTCFEFLRMDRQQQRAMVDHAVARRLAAQNLPSDSAAFAQPAYSLWVDAQVTMVYRACVAATPAATSPYTNPYAAVPAGGYARPPAAPSPAPRPALAPVSVAPARPASPTSQPAATSVALARPAAKPTGQASGDGIETGITPTKVVVGAAFVAAAVWFLKSGKKHGGGHGSSRGAWEVGYVDERHETHTLSTVPDEQRARDSLLEIARDHDVPLSRTFMIPVLA